MTVLASILALALSVGYSGSFREGDWVNFTDFRFITSAAMDQTTIYFGTTNGVIRYDRFANQWLDPMTVTDGIPDRRIDNIAYDPSYDRLWVTTPSGNAYYQPTFQQWYPGGDFPDNLAHNDYKASQVGILVAPFGYTYQGGQITDLQFRTYRLTKGVDDGFNHLYVGAWGMGAVVINPRYGRLDLLPFGPYSEDATAVVRVGDDFWTGAGPAEGSDRGITSFSKSLQDWRWFVPGYTTGIGSARITSAVGDGNAIWLGTDYGLTRYDVKDDRFTTLADFSSLPSTWITSLAEDSAWVYVGTDNGLATVGRVIEEKRAKHEKPPDPPDSVKADSATSAGPLSPMNRLKGWRINSLRIFQGHLYVATDRGVLRRLLGSKEDFQFVNTANNLLSTEIFDVAQSGDSLFFALRDNIVVVDTATGNGSIITEPSFQGQRVIRDIVVDSQNLWAATSLGLWKYRLSDGYHRLFSVGDGMISSDVRGLEMVGDYIWLATPKGAIRFYWNNPERID